MATMTASPPDEKTIQGTNRPAGKGGRRARHSGDEETFLGARFFLPKSGTRRPRP